MLNFTFVWWWQLTWREEGIPEFTTTKSEIKIKSMQEDKISNVYVCVASLINWCNAVLDVMFSNLLPS